MNVICFKNVSTHDVLIGIKNNDFLLIRCGEEKLLETEEGIEFFVKENIGAMKTKEKILGYVIAFLISIPLCLLDCIDLKSSEDDITFSPIFKLDCSTNPQCSIVISDSELEKFTVISDDDSLLKRIPVVLSSDIKLQLKEYTNSLKVLVSIPVIIFALLVCVSLKNSNMSLFLISLGAVFLVLFLFFFKKRSFSKTISEIILKNNFRVVNEQLDD